MTTRPSQPLAVLTSYSQSLLTVYVRFNSYTFDSLVRRCAGAGADRLRRARLLCAASIFYARQDELLRSTAETVASAYVQELEEERSVAKANEVVLAQMVFPNRYVEVVDADGHVVAWSHNLSGLQLIIPHRRSARQVSTAAVCCAERLASCGGAFVADRSKQLGFAIVAEPWASSRKVCGVCGGILSSAFL